MIKVFLLLTCISVLAADAPALQDKKPAPPAKGSADPVDAEYQKLLEQDEKTLREIERLFDEADAFAAKGAPAPQLSLDSRLESLAAPMRKAYEEFLKKHPNHIEARLAYGSFLNELGEEHDAVIQWEKVRETAPNNPAAWNNLANVYGHIGPAKKAIQYYEKAIELDPKEPVYLHNMATTVYLFRKDAMEMYRINESQVFDKALDLYRRALELDPNNLVLATDIAQTFYGIRPLREEAAFDAWNYALKLAKTDAEKQGIYLHLARVETVAGKFDEAAKRLEQVTLPDMQELKARLQRSLERRKASSEAPEEKPSE